IDFDVAELGDTRIEFSQEISGRTVDGRLHVRFKDPEARTITMRYRDPGTIMLVGKDKTGSYFATKFKPDLPKAEGAQGSTHAIFLVDTSLSSNPERFNVWLKLMKAILQNNRGGITQFRVVWFNVEAVGWGFAPNTSENVGKLMAYAQEIALEGATDLGAAFRACYAYPEGEGLPVPDVFLLSDGAATWGEADVNALSAILKREGSGPVFAYTTGFAGTDTRVLRHLARETGGAVFSVTGEAEVAAASRAHRSRPWRIVEATYNGGGDVLLAGRPHAVFPGQNMLITGRYGYAMRGPKGGQIMVERDGHRDAAVIRPIDCEIQSDLAPRVYGQVATGQLEEFHKLDEGTEDAAAAYARHFRVTGQTCSLLMLESEEDYKRYDIKPEEDAFVVKSTRASELVAKAIAAIGDSLADAKKRFMAWVGKLEKMPGFELELPTALKMALGQMPRASFEVRPEPLKCNLRTWNSIPGNLQEMLVSKRLDYDKLVAEAHQRLMRPKRPDPADSLKCLSSLVENSPGDGVLARDVAFSAMEWGLGSQSYYLLRRVATSRPWEPQTYHALAQVLAGMGKADLAIAYYELALAGKWHSRFGEFRKIAALDYMRFLKSIVEDPAARPPLTTVPDFAAARLESVAKEVGLEGADLMVTITWNTDSTDIDLHVREPSGEECYYEHTKTKSGGEITDDVTQGYGPEMYVLKKAPPGQYHVRVKFYSTNRQRASARTKVYATVYRDWNRPTETVTRKVVTLVDGKEFQDVGRFTVKK
ncbi:MAG: hypothetical protein ACYS9X_29050, partial [Planctomycetota bacterium]